MKTLQICSYFTDSKLYRNLFNALENQGEASDIFYFTDNKEDLSLLDEDLIVSNSYNPLERLLFYLKQGKVYDDAKDLLDFSKYSHSHAHSLMSNGYIANRIYRDYGLRYIVAVRRTDLFVFMKYKPYLKGLAVKILQEAEAVIFLSPVFLEKAVELFGYRMGEYNLRKKSYIIPNGIDELFFKNVPEKKSLSEELNLVFIGKVSDPNKNVKTIVKLVDELRAEGKEVNLKLIGSISDEDINKIKDKSYIRAMGRLSPEEIIESLKDDHIYIMPSYTETFGLVYVEAMSQGLPVIYTRGQGFDGQFQEGEVGYRVEADSIGEMKEAIRKITENYEQMSERAIEAAKKFNWHDIAKDYKKIYKEINVK